MTGEPHCAVGVPNVGPFGDPLLLVELAVAAEEHGWDGFFVWDHLLYHDQRWDVADPVTVIAAVGAHGADQDRRAGECAGPPADRRGGAGVGDRGPAVGGAAGRGGRAGVTGGGVHRV